MRMRDWTDWMKKRRGGFQQRNFIHAIKIKSQCRRRHQSRRPREGRARTDVRCTFRASLPLSLPLISVLKSALRLPSLLIPVACTQCYRSGERPTFYLSTPLREGGCVPLQGGHLNAHPEQALFVGPMSETFFAHSQPLNLAAPLRSPIVCPTCDSKRRLTLYVHRENAAARRPHYRVQNAIRGIERYTRLSAQEMRRDHTPGRSVGRSVGVRSLLLKGFVHPSKRRGEFFLPPPPPQTLTCISSSGWHP